MRYIQFPKSTFSGNFLLRSDNRVTNYCQLPVCSSNSSEPLLTSQLPVQVFSDKVSSEPLLTPRLPVQIVSARTHVPLAHSFKFKITNSKSNISEVWNFSFSSQLWRLKLKNVSFTYQMNEPCFFQRLFNFNHLFCQKELL